MKGESDDGIVFAWFWEGDQAFKFLEGRNQDSWISWIVVIVYAWILHYLQCVTLFVVKVSAINKSQFLLLKYILVLVSNTIFQFFLQFYFELYIVEPYVCLSGHVPQNYIWCFHNWKWLFRSKYRISQYVI